MIDKLLKLCAKYTPVLFKTGLFLILTFFSQVLKTDQVFAIEKPGEELVDVGLVDTRGNDIPEGLVFKDSEGAPVKLNEVLSQSAATLVVPAYYSCPRLCGLTQSAVAKLVNGLSLTLGSDYNILTVSFDEEDTPKRAGDRRETYLGKVTKKGALKKGWRFLTGGPEAIDILMNSLGFRYKEDGGEFAHTSAVYVVTKTGQISQYFTGIEFSPWDLRLALVDASHGRVGNALDQVLLFCFRFDPLKGKYTWAALGMMRVVGMLSLVGLVSLIVVQLRKERSKT